MTKMADVHPSPAGAHHEADDISLRAVLGFGLGLVVVTAVVSTLVWLLFTFFVHRESHRTPILPLAEGQEHRVPPEPRLQTDPRRDLLDLRTEEDRVLTTYGWVNQSDGVVRIPIDEAMKLTVKRGLPVRPPQESHDAR